MPAEFHFQICLGGGRENIGHSRQDTAIRLTLTLLSMQLQSPNLSEGVLKITEQ